jgi:hypothetical protein
VGDNLEGDLLDVGLDLGVGELAADQTLGSEDGVLGVDDGLATGGLANKTLAIWTRLAGNA